MFPQLPFGFISNTKLYRATSALKVGDISLNTYIGEVRNALSNVGIQNIDSYTDLQLLRYADSIMHLSDISLDTSISDLKNATSILNTSNITVETSLGSILSANSLTQISNIQTKAELTLDSDTPWTPANITTELWLDASDFSTITQSSNIVSQWNDKSGMNHHVAQSNPSRRPTYSSSGFNGLPSIEFLTNIWLDSLSNFSLSGNPNITIIACYKKTADSGHILGIGDINTDILMVFDDINFRGVLYVSGNHGFSIPTTGDIILSYEKPVGAINLSNAYINGAFRVPISSSSNTPNIAAAPMRIGSSKFGWLFGSLAEIIIINNVDATTRQKAEGYLAHKWGLAASLPSDHPYKINPPTV